MCIKTTHNSFRTSRLVELQHSVSRITSVFKAFISTLRLSSLQSPVFYKPSLYTHCSTLDLDTLYLFICRALRVRTPNLPEQRRLRELLVPSLLAMEVRQIVVLDLLRYQRRRETTRRRLSLRVLLFSKHDMCR